MRILIGDNSHSVIMDKATCNRIIDDNGDLLVEMGSASAADINNNNFLNQNK